MHLKCHKKCGAKARAVCYAVKQKGKKEFKAFKKLQKQRPTDYKNVMKKVIKGGKGGRLSVKQKGLVFSELESIERNKLAQHRRGFRLLDETDYVEHWAKRPGMDNVKAKAQFLADIKDIPHYVQTSYAITF